MLRDVGWRDCDSDNEDRLVTLDGPHLLFQAGKPGSSFQDTEMLNELRV